MTIETQVKKNTSKIGRTLIATFFVDSLLFGLPIDRVREINRHLDITRVPHSPEWVHGVVNLRGEVVTVVDLRLALKLPTADFTDLTRNVIVYSKDEAVGLVVDEVAEILSVPDDEIEPSPANVCGADGKLFRGVYATNENIVVILDLEELLP